jgi:hypothetical protein
MLPKVPEWKSELIDFKGFPTKDRMDLYYRDSLECIEHLFGNPLFDRYMEYEPRRVYKSAERAIRVYSEWMTSDGAWEMQVSISEMFSLIYHNFFLEKTT